MLIRGVELPPLHDVSAGAAVGNVDVRVGNGIITDVGALTPESAEPVMDAAGCALLPGLHDHHLHLLSLAAALDSLRCGPPEVADEADLIARLERAEGTGWIRGVGYHESVAGDIDSHWLDRIVPTRPVRIQHRSGRLWIVNSAARAQLAGASVPADGRIYDQDLLLAKAVGRTLPDVGRASRRLASYGVTGITDMTPANDGDTIDLFDRLQREGELLQRVAIAGADALPLTADSPRIEPLATKVHLHDSQLPALDELIRRIAGSHQRGRPVAVHCVTETELVFALAAIREAGAHPADRIEHASVTPPALIDQLTELNLMVVTQSNFVAERGDAYLEDIPAADQPNLYRAATLQKAGLRLAAGTDAPFGNPDPWLAMRAAVTRQTASGVVLGASEQLSPEAALSLFLGTATQPEVPRVIEPGAPADLCLLDRPWAEARLHLGADQVRATFVAGKSVFDRVN